jgi:hypothetical protein
VIDPTRIGVIHEAAIEIELTGDVHATCAGLRSRLSREELKCALRLALLDLENEKQRLD